MSRRQLPYLGSFLASGFVLALVSACGLTEPLDQGGLLNVYSSHHAREVDGATPDLGKAGSPRVLENDLGWTVTLTAAYVNIVDARLERCDGVEASVGFYWGPCVEDIVGGEDEASSGMGAASLDSGNYCEMRALFGPIDASASPENSEGHGVPGHEQADKTTVYLAGMAQSGDQSVEFEWSTAAEFTANLDLKTLDDGEPISVDDAGSGGTGVTIGVVYDAFFEGVDFTNEPDAAFEAAVKAALEDGTVVHFGAT